MRLADDFTSEACIRTLRAGLKPRSSEDVASRPVNHFRDEHRRTRSETSVSFFLIVLVVFTVEITTLQTGNVAILLNTLAMFICCARTDGFTTKDLTLVKRFISSNLKQSFYLVVSACIVFPCVFINPFIFVTIRPLFCYMEIVNESNNH